MNKDELKAFVSRIVLSQGNRYIKDLLRSAGVAIGTNKDSFEANLHQAIDSDDLTEGHVRAWLEAVEGWGSQHVYMFAAPEGQTFQSAENFRAAVLESQLAHLFDVDNTLAFPEAMQLTSVRLINNGFSFEWHKDTSQQKRDRVKDFEQDLDGDRYLYKAFRLRNSRAMMRFEFEFNRPFCAIFMQIAKDDEDHSEAIASVRNALQLLPNSQFPNRGVLTPAIDRIRNMQGGGVATRLARFDANGGSVLLRADVAGGIRAVPSVSQVGNAVQAQNFPSASGAFDLLDPADTSVDHLRFDISGAAARVSLRAQTTRDAMYGLLEYVWNAAQN